MVNIAVGIDRADSQCDGLSVMPDVDGARTQEKMQGSANVQTSFFIKQWGHEDACTEA